MTPLDAFSTAVALTHRSIDYDWAKLRAIQRAGGIDVFPYGTPNESRRAGKGLCREIAILAVDVAYQHGATRSRLLIGAIPTVGCSHCRGDNHAWCELYDETVPMWGDPTNGADIDTPAWYETKGYVPDYTLRYGPVDAEGHLGFPEQFDYRKAP